jgi:hypothetical protein
MGVELMPSGRDRKLPGDFDVAALTVVKEGENFGFEWLEGRDATIQLQQPKGPSIDFDRQFPLAQQFFQIRSINFTEVDMFFLHEVILLR